MLKENINIDESYTDRVVRQLVDETEIDFNAGRVRLPAVAYAWPFHYFGPGGLENALTMKKSSDFAQHILTNYGVDDEEFEGVLTKYIGVIDGKIRDGLVELIDKRDRENPHWLQENKNIDWDYTDRVVKQLVDETEIDFKNSRVRLDAAEFSFPFYSFGSRRAHRENIIFEPNSKFGNHVISNYGVDETEYKEIYAMYMGIIASRLQDHDENINHLHLHESSYTPKYYSPKWAVRRENDTLDRIVDGLVEESRIEYIEEIVHLADFSFQLFNAPFAYLEEIPDTSPFYQHCMDVYGLTPEEITYVWKEYRNIIRKEMQSNPKSNLISPFNESINESTGDNFLDTIVSQLVDETEIEYEDGMPHISAFPDPGFSMDTSFNLNLDLWENLFGNMFKSFWSHCREVYGLTDAEIQKVWWEYKKETLKKIDLKKWVINESTEDNFLDKIVDQLVDESIIDYDTNAVYFSDFPVPFNPLNLIPLPAPSLFADPFYAHGKEVYGLTPEEITYVWKKYKSIIIDKIKNKPLFALIDGRRLNESTEDNFLDTIVSQLVDETEIDYEYEIPHISAFPDPGFYIDSSFNLNMDLSENLFGSLFNSFWRHCRNVYGLTDPEIQKVWRPYKKEILKKIEWKGSLNESTEDNFLDKIVEQLLDETEVFNDRGQLRAIPPFIHNEWDEEDENEGRIVGDIQLAELINSVESKEFDYSLAFMDFKYYCKQMYGLTWEECHEVWDKYREALYNTDFSHLYTPNIHLDESIEDSFLDKIVNQLVDETILKDDEYGVPVAYPSWITDDGYGDIEVLIDVLLDSDKNSMNFTEFNYYVNNMYGLDEDEIEYVWYQYRSGIWDKEQNRINDYHRSLEDEDLNESKKDLNSYIHTVVDKMVDGTHLKYKKTTNTIWVKLPFYIELNNRGKNIEEVSSPYITDPTARVVAEIRKHLILIYGMDKWETDQAAIMYLSKMTEKIKDYKDKGFDDNWNELNESENKKEKYLDKVLAHLVRGTTIKKEIDRDVIIKVPYLPGGRLGNLDRDFYLSSHIFHSANAHDSFIHYGKEVYGLTSHEADYIQKKYIEILRYKIKHQPYELDESVDLSYTDDKDFPFLNKLANHAMRETEISRNAVMFPFIDHYISNNNFHRYFDGTPYDQLPFEATIEADQYLKQFGLTENEKEIWWDIYVIKVIDAINERDLRIIDSHGELYEHAEPEDPIYQQIANSIAQESEIVISPPPYNKMFLRSPAWKEAQHIENVIDQLTGRIKEVVPHLFAKHLKEIYNIKYPTFVNKVWELYKERIIDKIEKVHQTSNESTEDNVLDRIAHSMYKESISTPDSFPFDSTSMSFNDYMKNMYGISDEEAEYVYREFRYLKGWSEPDPYLPDPLNEHTFADDIDDPIYEKIANTLANESEIVISPSPYNKMFLRSPAWKEAQHIENVIDQLSGSIPVVPHLFAKHLKEIYNIKYPTFVQKIWELYKDKILKQIEDAQERLSVPKPNKQQKFFDHIVKTLVDETEIESTRHVHDEGRERIWVTPPFLTHGIDGGPRYQEGSVDWSDFSYFGYGYARYMKDIYGLTDKEGLKLWAVYYKALEKKVDELIERDRIIYGDD